MRRLEGLEVSYNRLGDQGMAALTHALAVCVHDSCRAPPPPHPSNPGPLATRSVIWCCGVAEEGGDGG
eukprot:1623087-Rhodomonas_salina.2